MHRRFQINGQVFRLGADDITRATSGLQPEPIKRHYTVVGGRRFPPKQVLVAATGLSRADFTTHHARRVLARLGFGSSSREEDDHRRTVVDPALPHGGREAEALRPYIGQWVARRGIDVIVAADTPQEVLRWVAQHGAQADDMFRVPRSQAEASGSAGTA